MGEPHLAALAALSVVGLPADRYDEPGCGMTEWRDVPLSLDRWASDLETVVEAARPQGPACCSAFRRARPPASVFARDHGFGR